MCGIDNIAITENTYDEIAHHFDPMLHDDNGSKEEIGAVEKFLSLLPDKQTCKIADLGCGVGKHGRYCAKMGYSVTGLDISKNMIALADEYNRDENYATIDLLEIADMCDFQTEETYDGVISFYAFIHLTYDQAEKALINLKRYLKKDAYIAITVYKGTRDGLVPELLTGKNRRDIQLYIYFRDYQMEEFIELFEKTGYIVTNTYEWADTDPITYSNKNYDSGVLCVIARYGG